MNEQICCCYHCDTADNAVTVDPLQRVDVVRWRTVEVDRKTRPWHLTHTCAMTNHSRTVANPRTGKKIQLLPFNACGECRKHRTNLSQSQQWLNLHPPYSGLAEKLIPEPDGPRRIRPCGMIISKFPDLSVHNFFAQTFDKFDQ